jgi:hypothetical protein
MTFILGFAYTREVIHVILRSVSPLQRALP